MWAGVLAEFRPLIVTRVFAVCAAGSGTILVCGQVDKKDTDETRHLQRWLA
jgi:hypothetical protein